MLRDLSSCSNGEVPATIAFDEASRRLKITRGSGNVASRAGWSVRLGTKKIGVRALKPMHAFGLGKSGL
jgi:hypothetical protein